jgi:hypothetical protein
VFAQLGRAKILARVVGMSDEERRDVELDGNVVPRKTVQETRQHVEAGERYPVLQDPVWKKTRPPLSGPLLQRRILQRTSHLRLS